jgi:hypothetical protein
MSACVMQTPLSPIDRAVVALHSVSENAAFGEGPARTGSDGTGSAVRTAGRDTESWRARFEIASHPQRPIGTHLPRLG